jgi:succinate dehydrogenase / fumarate reductase flavoprotein subunit
VHGANRLGTNSLVDLIVFGRRAGQHIAEYVKGANAPSIASDADEAARARIERIRDARAGDGGNPSEIYSRMQSTMMENVGVYRDDERMGKAVSDIQALREEFTHIKPQDNGTDFNAEILGLLELENLLDLSLLTAASAKNRAESRGAHSRRDYPERNDEGWLKHTLASLRDTGTVEIDYKSVDVSIWKPKPRTY